MINFEKIDFNKKWIEIYRNDGTMISIYKKDFENYYTINMYIVKVINTLYHHTTKDLNELKEMIDFISNDIEKILIKNIEVF